MFIENKSVFSSDPCSRVVYSQKDYDPRKIICWVHNSKWVLKKVHAVDTSFCHPCLLLPYVQGSLHTDSLSFGATHHE